MVRAGPRALATVNGAVALTRSPARRFEIAARSWEALLTLTIRVGLNDGRVRVYEIAR
jgi:hypothetical protein